MSNDLAKLLREAARMHDDAEISASRKGHVRNAEHHYRRSLECKAAAASLEAQEPVVVVHRNDAGQIVLQNADGTSFDMSKHIGESFYLHPHSSAVPEATDADLRKLWRDAGGSFHGPRVETGTMPEEKLLPFLRSLRHPPTSAAPECTRAMEAAAERYWNERRLKAFSNDPRTWRGVYEAMRAAAPQPAPTSAVPEGWLVTSEKEDDGTRGYVIGPRSDLGVATSVWEDSTDTLDRFIFAMLSAALQQGGGEHE